MKLKSGEPVGKIPGKVMTMLFFNSSLRTRLSFMAGMLKLGGTAIDFPLSSGYPLEYKTGAVMDRSTIEHAADAACVISRFSDVIGVRSSELITTKSESVEVKSWKDLKEDTVINSFIRFGSVPVINMESNVWHPCQGLADAMTIIESVSNGSRIKNQELRMKRELDEIDGFLRKSKFDIHTSKLKYVLTWVPHPKALPMATPNSELMAACDLGMEVTLVHPVGWELDSEIIKTAGKRVEEAGGNLKITNNQQEALRGADFVCAKSWGGIKYYGDWNREKEEKGKYKEWTVTMGKMNGTNDAYFLHCLPVRRNVEVTDEVLDSPNSLIYEEAENRMWVQMALLLTLLAKE